MKKIHNLSIEHFMDFYQFMLITWITLIMILKDLAARTKLLPIYRFQESYMGFCVSLSSICCDWRDILKKAIAFVGAFFLLRLEGYFFLLQSYRSFLIAFIPYCVPRGIYNALLYNFQIYKQLCEPFVFFCCL